MTPVISAIVDEVVTTASYRLVSLEDFEHWISAMGHRMRHDHALRFELENFKLYQANPAYYWTFIEKAYR